MLKQGFVIKTFKFCIFSPAIYNLSDTGLENTGPWVLTVWFLLPAAKPILPA